jgi:hypothetical protein
MAAKKSAPQLSEEALAHLTHLAETMSERLGKITPHDKRVGIIGPMPVTIWRKKGFGKANLIGGEDFLVDSVYIGSPRNGSQMIFRLTPTSPADYAHIELTQEECEGKLLDWRGVVDKAVGGNFYMKLEEVRNIDITKMAEAERARQAAEYKEFGAW